MVNIFVENQINENLILPDFFLLWYPWSLLGTWSRFLMAGNLVKCGLHQYGVCVADNWGGKEVDDDGIDATSDGLVVEMIIELLLFM